MNIKIAAISANSKKELINKIKNQNFTSHKDHQYRAAVLQEKENDIKPFTSDIDEIFKKNSETEFFQEENFYFYSGEKHDKVAFLFPGQGSQYINMGKEIKKLADPQIYETANKIFSSISDKKKTVLNLMFPDSGSDEKESELNLRQTDAAQPAIGITSAAYLDILGKFNIFPCAASGHSFGEITALFAAGGMSYETFIEIACTRGKLMAECGKDKDAGSMMAVLGTIEKIQEIIKLEKLDLIIANKNSPKQNVVSGATKEIDKAVKIFRKHKLRGIKLPVAAAFHSSLVSDAALPFSEFINKTEIKKLKFPVTSNTSGTFHSDDPGKIKELLAKQLTSPVSFTDNIKALFNSKIKVFLEAGPKKVLKDLAGQSAMQNKNYRFTAIDESAGKAPEKDFASTLAFLWVLGFETDIKKWNNM